MWGNKRLPSQSPPPGLRHGRGPPLLRSKRPTLNPSWRKGPSISSPPDTATFSRRAHKPQGRSWPIHTHSPSPFRHGTYSFFSLHTNAAAGRLVPSPRRSLRELSRQPGPGLTGFGEVFNAAFEQPTPAVGRVSQPLAGRSGADQSCGVTPARRDLSPAASVRAKARAGGSPGSLHAPRRGKGSSPLADFQRASFLPQVMGTPTAMCPRAGGGDLWGKRERNSPPLRKRDALASVTPHALPKKPSQKLRLDAGSWINVKAPPSPGRKLLPWPLAVEAYVALPEAGA